MTSFPSSVPGHVIRRYVVVEVFVAARQRKACHTKLVIQLSTQTISQ